MWKYKSLKLANPSNGILKDIYKIDNLNRDEQIYLFYIKSGRWCYKTESIKRYAESIAYNSTANSVRLVDVMRQVTKSIVVYK
jgi:hypothetical protein